MLLLKRFQIFLLIFFSIIIAFGFQARYLSITTNTAEALVPVPEPVSPTPAWDLIEVAPVYSLFDATTTPEIAEAPVAETLDKSPWRIAKPARLSIPAIGLEEQIIPLGVNEKGEMDVPSGDTSDIGWFKEGPRPGQRGSAVLDAHVFAAFSELDQLRVGDSVYVITESGAKLKFEVVQATVYKLSEISPDLLFNRNDAKRLNLITCAGQATADGSTYTHRLIVYTKFVGEVV